MTRTSACHGGLVERLSTDHQLLILEIFMRRTFFSRAIRYDRYNEYQPNSKDTGQKTGGAAAIVAFVAGATTLGYCHDSYHRRKNNPFLMFTDPTAHRAADIWDKLTSPVIK